MASAAAQPFRLTLTDGRTLEGAQFDDGFVVLYHPDEPCGPCTIAISLNALTTEQPEGHWLHGATPSWHH
ncbi:MULTISPECIES: hypothetical protein [Streptomyces]